MAIIFNPNKKIITLQTAHTTYQMQVDRLGYLLHLYYGAKSTCDMDYVLTYADRGFSGNPYAAGMNRTYSLDTLPQEYPTLGTGDFRNIALDIKNEQGTESVELLYKSHEIRDGKYALKGLPAVWASDDEAQTLEIVLGDDIAGVEVHLLYGVLEACDVITRSVLIKNTGSRNITIEKAHAACLDMVYGDYDVIRFYGKHAMERNLERTHLGHGTLSFGSRRGTSSHQYNPAVILAQRDTTENAGDCYGMLFVYSGNFSCEAEKDQINQTRLLMGLSDELFSYPLAAGETFTVPEVIMSYSADGFSQLSHQYHTCISEHVCRSRFAHEVRPVLINSWVPIMIILALAISSMLNNKKLKFRGFFRTAIFLPCVTSLVAYSIIFKSLFATDGIINSILMNIHLVSEPIQWLTNPIAAKVLIIIAITWRWTGYNMVFYLAGLQNIEYCVYEAAKIDGCSYYSIFFRIVLPLITPALITSTIFSFMWRWDDFLGALLYVNKTEKYPVSLALKMFCDPSSSSDYGAMFAGWQDGWRIPWEAPRRNVWTTAAGWLPWRLRPKIWSAA